MQFIDEAIIEVRSGNGGPGSVHFRREKYKPNLGPDGGDGGDGGSVYLLPTTNMQSLIDFRFQPRYAGEDGEPGGGNDCNGRKGQDLIIRVPVGTTIKDAETGRVLIDLVEKDTQVLFLKGGRGGLGNMNFATSTRQAPDYAQPGLPGQSLKVKLELKLIADVGLVGFPNAGKSTLISKLSSAKPKIADYPFTTLVPNLGVVRSKNLDFTIADIPGIIEGAADGKGLGLKFLKHIDRTRLLLVMLDLDPYTGRNLGEEVKILINELNHFSDTLKDKPKILVFNKSDAFTDQQSGFSTLAEFAKAPFLQERGIQDAIDFSKGDDTFIHEPILISAVSGQGLNILMDAVDQQLTRLGPRNMANTLTKEFLWGQRELL